MKLLPKHRRPQGGAGLRAGADCAVPTPAPSLFVRAVTILELLVAVSLISFIILALYQMFDRTQAQMRKAVREVDKFEGGRAAAELIRRDISQMAAGNSSAGTLAVNFYASTNWSAGSFAMTNNGTNVVQQNLLQDLFFVSLDPAATPLNWMGVSYRVASSTDPTTPAVHGLGTLWRWSTNANRFDASIQQRLFSQFPPANYWQRVADNVVHFRVTAVTSGVPVLATNVSVPAPTWAAVLTNQALPAHIEIELGYVDSRTSERARGFLPNTNLARTYLSTNLDAVQMFRLHVPIRSGLQ